MKNQDFTTSILVDKTPGEVFRAVNNPRGWWSENIQGRTDQLNSEFDYHYLDVHRTKFRVITLVPDQRVVWDVLSNYFNFTEDETEWTGTKVVFDITEKDGQTELRFTHQGLVPAVECYKVCFDAWTHYIKDSLYSLITTGKGQPSPLQGGFNEKIIEKFDLRQEQ